MTASGMRTFLDARHEYDILSADLRCLAEALDEVRVPPRATESGVPPLAAFHQGSSGGSSGSNGGTTWPPARAAHSGLEPVVRGQPGLDLNERAKGDERTFRLLMSSEAAELPGRLAYASRPPLGPLGGDVLQAATPPPYHPKVVVATRAANGACAAAAAAAGVAPQAAATAALAQDDLQSLEDADLPQPPACSRY